MKKLFLGFFAVILLLGASVMPVEATNRFPRTSIIPRVTVCHCVGNECNTEEITSISWGFKQHPFFWEDGETWALGPCDEEPTPTPTPTEEVTPTPTEEVTPTPTEEATPTPTEEVTPTPTEEVTPTPTEEVTPTPTDEPTPTNTPTNEATPTPTMDVEELPDTASGGMLLGIAAVLGVAGTYLYALLARR